MCIEVGFEGSIADSKDYNCTVTIHKVYIGMG